MNLYKPTELLKLLKDLDLKPKKSLSQNFLIDKNIVAKIIAFSDISNKSVVLEIGPGFGTLTSFILEKCKKLIAIEQDKILTKILKKNLKNQKLEIKNANFLDLDLNFLKNFNQKVKVISSIPYHLTQPIIMKLLKNHFLFSSIILLIQKEVAQKIISSPNSKKYNSFSLLINFYADVQIISYVSKNSFLPKPKVDSAIIKLNLKKPKKTNFEKLIKISFSKRRKKLLSSLKAFYNEEKLKKAFSALKISENARAENLSLNQYLDLLEKIN